MTLVAANLPASRDRPETRRAPKSSLSGCQSRHRSPPRRAQRGPAPSSARSQVRDGRSAPGCTAGSGPGGRPRASGASSRLTGAVAIPDNRKECLSSPGLGQLVGCALVTTRVTLVSSSDHAVCIRSVANKVFRTPGPAGSHRINRADARVASARQCPDRGVAAYPAP